MRHRFATPTVVRLILVVLLSVAAVHAADAMRAGEATFTPPDGWKVQKQGDGLVRVVSPDENAMILVMPGEAHDGDLEPLFETTWKKLRQGLEIEEVVSGGTPKAATTDAGYESVGTVATLRLADDNRLTCRYAVLRNGDAVCGLAYLGTAKAYKQYAAAYDALARDFDLGGRRKKPVEAAAPALDAAEEPGPNTERPAAGRRKAAKAAPDAPAVEPHTVAGRVTDAQGNLIDVEGAKPTVVLSGTTLAGHRTTLNFDVEDTGLYSQEVPDGVYKIYGFIDLDYNGRAYHLPLHPEDNKDVHTSHGSRKGVVKNFVWKLTGLKPGSDKKFPTSYYGGTLEVSDTQHYNNGKRLLDRYPGATVSVTLKPRGPLLDGSKGAPLNFEADVAQLDGWPKFFDVPVGKYAATAKLVLPDGEVPLKLSTRYPGSGIKDSAFARTAAVEFVQPSVHEGLRAAHLALSE